MRTECLVAGDENTALAVTVRFLHLLARSATRPAATDAASSPQNETMERGAPAEQWQEGIEREVSVRNLVLSDLLFHPRYIEIAFSGGRISDHAANSPMASSEMEIVREQQSVVGAVRVEAERLQANLFKLSVQIENVTPGTAEVTNRHDAVMLHSFISTHTIMQVRQGQFVSLLEAPEELQTAAEGCKNVRTWPVLVGGEGERDTMLSSPIILYDYPQIAPESPGPLFDGTEIDEILILRIMTLTDEEKREMRQDQRTREILERVEALTPEQFMKLHGTIRSMAPVEDPLAGVPTEQDFPGVDYPPPAAVVVADREIRAGDHVRLRPRVRADAFDMLLDGKTARVEIIQQDFENRLYLVVTLDDDPGREQWDERVLPGHRFFFFPEEVEPLEDAHTHRRMS
jgi:hypothetical protein